MTSCFYLSDKTPVGILVMLGTEDQGRGLPALSAWWSRPSQTQALPEPLVLA